MRDFVDQYLKEIKVASEEKRVGSSFYGEEGILNLTNVLVDFFLAGSETTSTTLNWGMLYMLMNPSIQKKVLKLFVWGLIDFCYLVIYWTNFFTLFINFSRSKTSLMT